MSACRSASVRVASLDANLATTSDGTITTATPNGRGPDSPKRSCKVGRSRLPCGHLWKLSSSIVLIQESESHGLSGEDPRSGLKYRPRWRDPRWHLLHCGRLGSL